METEHIRLVRVIAAQGSISAAARELGITQPALTKILLRVEDYIGGRLFERRPRGITPTAAGRLFLERTERVGREMQVLRADVQSLETGLTGRVAIGVGQFWIGHIVPLVVNRLRREAPDVQQAILTGTREQLVEMLLRGEIDMMLGRFADDLPATLVAEKLADVRLYLTVRTGHPMAKLRRKIMPEDLRGYTWVLPPPSDPTAIHMASVFRAHMSEPVTARVEAVSQNVISALLGTSDLVTVLPGIPVNEPMPGLARLDCDWLNWSSAAGVIRLSQTSLPACGERFLRLLRAAVG